MNETEVLRIEGNVTVPKVYEEALKAGFHNLMETFESSWSGNITDQDSPTGMRLYRVEEVEGYKEKIVTIEGLLLDERTVNSQNDKTFKELSEKYNELVKAHRLLTQVEQSTALSNIELQKVNMALNLRLESKENTRWRTFTKWWKEL